MVLRFFFLACGMHFFQNPMTGIQAYALKLTLLSTLTGSIISCSSVQVSSQKAPGADLASLQTFAFTSPSAGPSTEARSPSSIIDTQIKSSVKTNLAQIDITPASSTVVPDFVVAYRTNVFNVVNANQSSVGVGFGAAPGVGVGFSAPMGSANVEQRGSLTLSFIDPQKNTEIWRSTATAGLDGSNRDIEKLQIAIQKMIDEFKETREKKA